MDIYTPHQLTLPQQPHPNADNFKETLRGILSPLPFPTLFDRQVGYKLTQRNDTIKCHIWGP